MLNPFRLCMVTLIVAAGGYFFTGFVFNVVLNEGSDRRHQDCIYFESDHRQDVQRVINTYKYLSSLPREEWKLTFNQLVIQQAPMLYQEASTDNAPPYCNRPNTGLPEPDPILPKKRDFSFMLEKK